MGSQPTRHSGSSFFQLMLFTAFLFLLVAIPYTIYSKSTQPKAVTPLTALPVAQPSPFPSVTPPPASTATSCVTVPNNYPTPQATPAAYFFQDTTRHLCYPPTLPPFPFTWQPYTSYQYDYTLDTPSNWIDKSTTIQHTFIHIFASEDTASLSATPTVSFSWNQGTDPYASESSYVKNPIVRSGKTGTVYTKSASFIAAVFPESAGYLILEASRTDSAFYAFEHMLDSIKFQ